MFLKMFEPKPNFFFIETKIKIHNIYKDKKHI